MHLCPFCHQQVTPNDVACPHCTQGMAPLFAPTPALAPTYAGMQELWELVGGFGTAILLSCLLPAMLAGFLISALLGAIASIYRPTLGKGLLFGSAVGFFCSLFFMFRGMNFMLD